MKHHCGEPANYIFVVDLPKISLHAIICLAGPSTWLSLAHLLCVLYNSGPVARMWANLFHFDLVKVLAIIIFTFRLTIPVACLVVFRP